MPYDFRFTDRVGDRPLVPRLGSAAQALDDDQLRLRPFRRMKSNVRRMGARPEPAQGMLGRDRGKAPRLVREPGLTSFGRARLVLRLRLHTSPGWSGTSGRMSAGGRCRAGWTGAQRRGRRTGGSRRERSGGRRRCRRCRGALGTPRAPRQHDEQQRRCSRERERAIAKRHPSQPRFEPLPKAFRKCGRGSQSRIQAPTPPPGAKAIADDFGPGERDRSTKTRSACLELAKEGRDPREQ
jgi:hypothetical protein